MKNQHPWTGPGPDSPGGRTESPSWKEAPTRIIELAAGWGIWPIWPTRLLLFPDGVCSGGSLLHSIHSAPFHPKPVYTRGSGAHGRGAASHISRLIVSICRAPSIRQFRHWTVSRPKRVGDRPGNRDIIAAGVEDDRHFSLSSLVRSLQPANCWYYDRECREIRGDWRGEIVDKSGWILKQIVGGWIRDEFSENRDYLSSNWGD